MPLVGGCGCNGGSHILCWLTISAKDTHSLIKSSPGYDECGACHDATQAAGVCRVGRFNQAHTRCAWFLAASGTTPCIPHDEMRAVITFMRVVVMQAVSNHPVWAAHWAGLASTSCVQSESLVLLTQMCVDSTETHHKPITPAAPIACASWSLTLSSPPWHTCWTMTWARCRGA